MDQRCMTHEGGPSSVELTKGSLLYQLANKMGAIDHVVTRVGLNPLGRLGAQRPEVSATERVFLSAMRWLM